MDLRRWLVAAVLMTTASTQPRALDLVATEVAAPAEDLLGGGAGAWAGVGEQTIDLNRTPPLYEGDPVDDGVRPTLHVAVVRTSDGIFVRMRWTDPTDSAPRRPQAAPDVGEAAIYKQHSMDIERFGDAACVMIPHVPGELVVFPSLTMGEAARPVHLYYWNQTRGFERLEAAGRGTTTRTNQQFPGGSRRTGKGWEVVFQIPAQPASTPLSFAVWDGDRAHRDGLKFYSVWYELTP